MEILIPNISIIKPAKGKEKTTFLAFRTRQELLGRTVLKFILFFLIISKISLLDQTAILIMISLMLLKIELIVRILIS